MNEFELWKHIQKSDVKALENLHKKYFHQMCLFAAKSVSDTQLIENIVSDCFIKLWKNRNKIEIKISLKSYLFRTLRNQIIDNFRKKKVPTILMKKLPDIPDDSQFDDQQRYVKLYQAIMKLPMRRREILELAVFDLLSYQEIADKLGISKNTVKTQIARAYQFLKEALDPCDFFFFCWIQQKN